MPVREPSWWYAPDRRFARTLLAPVATLYGAVAARRMTAEPTYRSSLPVICVGNLTAGGTGKTPLTALIGAHLSANGAAPAILSRGYGGRLHGPHWVDADRDQAHDVGDEPLQHVARAPTLVARDRAAGARAIENDLRAFTHILMDDGLQNPVLAKSLGIAVVDARRGVGNGAVIPAGPLRAPLAAQLRRTDVVVVNHGFQPHEQRGRPHPISNFRGPVFDATIAPSEPLDWLARSPVVAYAGIGAPAQFFAMLRALGAAVIEEFAFADHHPVGEAEALHLLARAKAADAMLVSTQKDLARLAGRTGAAGQLRVATRTVPISMQVSDPAFLRLIDRLTAG